jgi:negative regulator of replication initiation
MMNGNVVLLSYKNKMKTSNKTTINNVDKVREVKKAMVQLLVSKKSSMEIDEKMKFLEIDEKLYSWINGQSCDITNTVMDAIKILKSYNKHITV